MAEPESQDTDSMTVAAWQVDADGNLSLAGDRTTMDADGSYSLLLDESVDDTQALLIQAEHESAGDVAGRVLLEAEITRGDTVFAAPMDVESHVESDAALWLHTEGLWDQSVHSTATLRSAFDQATAVDLMATADGQASLRTLAEGWASGATARHQTMVELGAMSTADYDAFLAEIAMLRAEVDASLHDRALVADSAVAWAEARIDAAITRGVATTEAESATQSFVEASIHFAETTDAPVETTALVHLEMARSVAVDETVLTGLEAMNRSEATIEAVTFAGIELRDELMASLDGSFDVDADIAAAWASYRTEVTSILEADADPAVSLALTTAFEATEDSSLLFDAAIDSIDAQADASVTADAVVTAMTSFRTSVAALAPALVTAGMTQAEAAATVEILAALFVA